METLAPPAPSLSLKGVHRETILKEFHRETLKKASHGAKESHGAQGLAYPGCIELATNHHYVQTLDLMKARRARP